MPDNVFAPGRVGLISRSGMLARGSTKGYPSVVIYRHVLVTGGAGFVGSNLAIWLATHHPEMRVVAADNLRRRGAEATLPRLRAHNVTFAHCDVRSPEDLQSAVLDVDIDLLIDCSAEPSVRAGYGEAPIYAINTNLMGLVNCLELARRHAADVLFLSTSRVYPIAPLNDICTTENATRLIPVDMEPRAGVTRDGITEDFPLAGPRSLYGATKLASELLLQEYGAMYGVRFIVDRCGVLAGPWQLARPDQGIFAYWVAMHRANRPLTYTGWGGTGKQVRDLLHIDDLAALVNVQLERFGDLAGQTYNVGGGLGCSLSLAEATDLCRAITGHHVPISSVAAPSPADIKWYVSDTTRVRAATGWAPRHTPAQILADIDTWLTAAEPHVGYLWRD
jgi:CDP-paratose 2-epimerase